MTDFKEIAHSGGKITFSVTTDAEGQRELPGWRPVITAGAHGHDRGICLAAGRAGWVDQHGWHWHTLESAAVMSH